MKKIRITSILILIMALLLAVACDNDPLTNDFDADLSKVKISISQKEVGNSLLEIDFAGITGFSFATVVGTMDFQGEAVVVYKNVIEFPGTSDNLSKSIDVEKFGQYDFDIFLNSNKAQGVIQLSDINVVSNEYNIALINATFPVLLFSLDMISSNSNIPTSIAVERPLSLNWDSLPAKSYLLPLMPESKNNNNDIFHADLVPRTIEYVKQLKEISPADAKYNLYITDNYPELILKVLYLNGITEENSNITLLSDGSGTYVIEQKALSGTASESVSKYNSMVAKWTETKTAALSGDTRCLDGIIAEVGRNYQILQDYACVIATEETNVEWWVGRSDLLTSADEALQTEIRNASTQKNLGSELNGLSSEQANKLKNLYAFDSEMFSTAVENNKKIMLFLGTRNDQQSDFYLRDYLDFITHYYGGEFALYYKGHPASPSELVPERQVILDEIGVGEVNASIPAELILFFIPDVYLCGYPSTTFQASDQEHSLTLMANRTGTIETIKENATSSNYIDNIDSFMMKVDEGVYRMEFAVAPESGVEYALWRSASPDQLEYYDITNTLLNTINLTK